MTKEQEKIVELRSYIKDLEQDLNDVRADRDKYRGKVVQYFKWFISLLSKGERPSLPWTICDIAKLLNDTKQFYFDTKID